MSAAVGLNGNLRIMGTSTPDVPNPEDISVEVVPDGDAPELDEKGNVLSIKHGDGSVTVSLDGKPLEAAANDSGPERWFDNLAEKIDSSELSRIVEDLLRGVDDDIQSRKDWVDARAKGIELLGLKLETPNTQGAADGAPVEGMSKVRHPLLLESVLRFQANATAELLPTDGPVKIRNDDNDATLKTDELANSLERDMNHYLTAVATEYYPDTRRMLFMIGFGGMGFKKGYFCPLRNRPVLESVDANDLIVNDSATDLANAQRITHRTYLKPSTVKRLQILKVYRDVDLSDPVMPTPDAVEDAERAQQGITPNSMRRPQDREREIYEIDCELNIKGFEHKIDGKETGLEIPYTVTIDVSSRQALSVVRNYNAEDEKLPTARTRYIEYTFVPGLGFYAIGLLHILGNTANAATAAWREMLDTGMFANFPGFLIAKMGTRQNTNILRVPPGAGAQVDTGGLPIKDAIKELPYQTQHMPALMQLVQDMVTNGQRVGGTSELQVGEGRQEAPVGTTLALIDQAIKIVQSVHKGLHASQAREFKLLIDLFREHPESFWQKKCRSHMQWDEPKFLEALSRCELVPQADPNTASMGHRVMKVQALKMLQQASPNLYDPVACDTAALHAIGWAHPEQFFVPPAVQAQPPPQLIQAQAQMKNEADAAQAKLIEATARQTEAQARAKEADAKVAVGHFIPKAGLAGGEQQGPTTVEAVTAAAKLKDAETRAQEVGLKAHEIGIEDRNRDLDRQAKERDTHLDFVKDLIMKNADIRQAEREAQAVQDQADRDAKAGDEKS